MLPDIDDIPFLNERVKSLPVTPSSIPTTSDQFLLPAFDLIPGDPIDGECPDGQWLCSDNTTCIFDTQKCNGIVDCHNAETSEGGEDEDDCGEGSANYDESTTTTTTTIKPRTSTTESWLDPNFLESIGAVSPTSPPIEDEGPDVSTKGWYPGDEQARRNRDEFDQLDCRRHFLQPKPRRLPDAVPEECMRILKSISFLTFQGAHLRMCGCHETGSRESMCDKYYGGCLCKNLVVGRRCDSCAPASYGFSSLGCTRYQKISKLTIILFDIFCKGVIATEQAVKTSSATKTQGNASATLSSQPLVGSVTSVSPATGTSPTASSANATGTPTPATLRLASATTVGMQLWATSVTNVSLATTEDQRWELIKSSAESASVQTQRPAGTTLPGRELVSWTQPP